MKTLTISCIIGTIAALSLQTLAASFAVPDTNIFLEYEIEDDSVLITGCNKDAAGDLIIPAMIDDLKICTIKSRAFEDCAHLTRISIPNCVTFIGTDAFTQCDSLRVVRLPDSYLFSKHAFLGANALNAFIVSNDHPAYRSIDGVLYGKDMASLLAWPAAKPFDDSNIPRRVIAIGDDAFRECALLRNISIPRQIKDIGASAFSGCPSLLSVEIRNGVNTIGRSAFHSCPSLQRVKVSRSVTEIGDSAFACCDSLQNIEVAKKNSCYTSVGGVLFNKERTELVLYPRAKSISLYKIPASVINIRDGAFYEAKSLAGIWIPEGITSIGKKCFHGCNKLEYTYLPTSLSEIGFFAFYGCSSLSKVIIPPNVKTIGFCAFGMCESLSSITIPDSISKIEKSAFYNCSSLRRIEIPSGVTRISDSLFDSCSSLSTIVIPESVISIGKGAFSGCSSLAQLNIPPGVERIEERAFIHSALERVSIPSGVTSISDLAFAFCSELNSATFEGNAPEHFDPDVFTSAKDGFTIYFYKDATGFTTPTWNGYPCVEIERPE